MLACNRSPSGCSVVFWDAEASVPNLAEIALHSILPSRLLKLHIYPPIHVFTPMNDLNLFASLFHFILISLRMYSTLYKNHSCTLRIYIQLSSLRFWCALVPLIAITLPWVLSLPCYSCPCCCPLLANEPAPLPMNQHPRHFPDTTDKPSHLGLTICTACSYSEVYWVGALASE